AGSAGISSSLQGRDVRSSDGSYPRAPADGAGEGGQAVRILYVPHASWATPQRAKLLSEALAWRHEVHATDWVANFRSVRDLLSSNYWRNYVPRSWTENRVHVHHVPRITPALQSKA